MVLDIPIQQILVDLREDGSSLLGFGKTGNPQRRGHHPQELIYYCYERGYYVIEFEAVPTSYSDEGECYVICRQTDRVYEIMKNNMGVLTGQTKSGKNHSVAWNKKMIYDPNGTIYPLENNYLINSFFLVKQYEYKQ